MIFLDVLYIFAKLFAEYSTKISVIINETNKEKEMAKLISEKCKVVLEDKIFQERIAPIKTALENNEITNEKFQEIFVELFKERTKEIFNNGNHTDVND